MATPHAKSRGAPSIKWSRLSLKTLPTLQAEVDYVCTLYGKNPTEDLYRTLSFRMDELDLFYLANDEDNRAALIPQMRHQLEMTLQRNGSPMKVGVQSVQNTRILPFQEQEEKEDPFRDTLKAISKQHVRSTKQIYAWECVSKNKGSPEAEVHTQEKESFLISDLIQANRKHGNRRKDPVNTPADLADQAARNCYAAAHGTLSPSFPVGPFGGNFDAAEKNSHRFSNEGSSKSGSDSKVQENMESELFLAVEFKLTKEEYFEVLRRKHIRIAKQRHEKLESMSQHQSSTVTDNLLPLTSLIRDKSVYVDPKPDAILAREERKAAWVSEKNFV